MIENVMSLHVFDGKIIRPKRGGSIGLDLTGVVADMNICRWDELFKKKLFQSGIMIHVYKIHKDDIDLPWENRKENGKEQKEKERNTMKEWTYIKLNKLSVQEDMIKAITDNAQNKKDGKS